MCQQLIVLCLILFESITSSACISVSYLQNLYLREIRLRRGKSITPSIDYQVMPTHYFVGQNSNKKSSNLIEKHLRACSRFHSLHPTPNTSWTSLNRTRFGWRRKTPLASLCLVSPATLRHSYLDLICNLKCSDHPQDPRMHRPIYDSMERLIWECWPVTRVRDRVDNFEHALLPGLWGWVWIVWVLSALAMCLSFPHSTYIIYQKVLF